ncbi:hypothetical protein K439DRAFT_1244363, partial [Ramaria rubella]
SKLIHALAQTLSNAPATNQPESDGSIEEALENGGPKTQELPPELVTESRLIQEIDFSPDLLQALHKIVQKHANAFGLDGRLGSYDAKVEINLRPGTKEISLPPYNASPAKREIIDKQMDAWIKLEVIEPSKSPWGFPVLIVYRNGK